MLTQEERDAIHMRFDTAIHMLHKNMPQTKTIRHTFDALADVSMLMNALDAETKRANYASSACDSWKESYYAIDSAKDVEIACLMARG